MLVPAQLVDVAVVEVGVAFSSLQASIIAMLMFAGVLVLLLPPPPLPVGVAVGVVFSSLYAKQFYSHVSVCRCMVTIQGSPHTGFFTIVIIIGWKFMGMSLAMHGG